MGKQCCRFVVIEVESFPELLAISQKVDIMQAGDTARFGRDSYRGQPLSDRCCLLHRVSREHTQCISQVVAQKRQESCKLLVVSRKY
jgi:hypothetical protein